MPNKFTLEKFIHKAKSKHGNTYDYSLVNYEQMYIPVKIICKEHGLFIQKPVKHLLGHGCSICNLRKRNNNFRLTKEEFINKCKTIHGDIYDYSLVNYTNNRTPIEIICKKHGSFFQIPYVHFDGKGCPKCYQSHGERKIENYLINKNFLYQTNYKFSDCKYKRKLPFDFYLPLQNICIEFDGIQHFKDTAYGSCKIIQIRDSIKTEYCEKNKIKLIRISYKEIDKIESILDSYL